MTGTRRFVYHFSDLHRFGLMVATFDQLALLNLVKKGHPMHTTTFDTLEFTEQLRASGVPEEQAKGHAKALVTVMKQTESRVDERADKRDRQSEERLDGLASKRDLDMAKTELKRDIKELELRMTAETAPLKWGMAVCVGGIIALILKSFFPH